MKKKTQPPSPPCLPIPSPPPSPATPRPDTLRPGSPRAARGRRTSQARRHLLPCPAPSRLTARRPVRRHLLPWPAPSHCVPPAPAPHRRVPPSVAAHRRTSVARRWIVDHRRAPPQPARRLPIAARRGSSRSPQRGLVAGGGREGRRDDADDQDGARRASIVRGRSGALGRPERRSRRGEATRAREDGAGGAARGRGGTRGMEDGGRLAGARARQHVVEPLPVAPGRWSRQWDAVATRSDMAANYPMICCWRPSTDCRCRRPSSGERLHAGSGDASSPAHATFQQSLDTQIQVLSVSHYLCVLNIAVLPTLPEFLPTADLVRITSARALHKVEGLMMDDVATVKDEIK